MSIKKGFLVAKYRLRIFGNKLQETHKFTTDIYWKFGPTRSYQIWNRTQNYLTNFDIIQNWRVQNKNEQF